MSNTCSNCNQICVSKEPKNSNDIFGYPCDLCKKLLCKKCSGISTTELRTLILNSRVMPYICKLCLPKLQDTLQLVNRVTALETSFAEIKSDSQRVIDLADLIHSFSEEMKSMRASFSSCLGDIRSMVREEIEGLKRTSAETQQKTDGNVGRTETNRSSVESEEMMMELIERQKRECNIMVMNVKEPQSLTSGTRRQEDLNSAINLLKDFNVDTTDLKVFRVGKVAPNKNRLLKIILKSRHDAIAVLKNRENIPQGVKVFADQTKKQRDYYLSIKSQLEERMAAGDTTKTIRFINNVPTIVNKNQASQKN